MSNPLLHTPSIQAEAETVRFIPMGISKVSDSEACVGAIAENGAWVRPETPSLAEVIAVNPTFSYQQWSSAGLASSVETDARPEDRHMVQQARVERPLPEGTWADFLKTHLDGSVEEVFSDLRSLGLIKVQLQSLYFKQSTGGRTFLRASFEDAVYETYDWIVSEVRLSQELAPHMIEGAIPPALVNALSHFLRSAELFFVIALTKPNNRFPGKFRGCQPIVIGVHSVPDYAAILSQLKQSARQS